MEEWLPVIGYEDLYLVSSHGRVWTNHYGRLLKPRTTTDGYTRVMLCRDTLRKEFRIHQLVAAAFFGPKPQPFQVNHIDGVKDNNRIENLEWVSPSENLRHAYRSGLKASRKGESHHNAQITDQDVHNIVRTFIDDEIIPLRVAAKLGIKRDIVVNVLNGNSWAHITSSYSYNYAEIIKRAKNHCGLTKKEWAAMIDMRVNKKKPINEVAEKFGIHRAMVSLRAIEYSKGLTQ